MIVRLKLASGGKINLVATNIESFSEGDNGSTVRMTSGIGYDVEESARSIRNAFKRLSSTDEAPAAE